MPHLRICRTCHGEFSPSSHNHFFCSLSCRINEKIPSRFCLTCGDEFVPRKLKQQRKYYCSKGCEKGLRFGRSREEFHASFYHKDRQLFAQRMAYTLNGVTWWGTPCCYCGDPAQAEEHVFPVSAFRKLFAAGEVSIPADLLRIVPVCHECNSLLGDKVFRSFEEKRLWLKGVLAHRYRKTIENPNWSKEDIAALEGALQTWIASGQGLRDLVFERLRF